MQRLEISGAVRPIYGSLGVKRLKEKLVLLASGKQKDNIAIKSMCTKLI